LIVIEWLALLFLDCKWVARSLAQALGLRGVVCIYKGYALLNCWQLVGHGPDWCDGQKTHAVGRQMR